MFEEYIPLKLPLDAEIQTKEIPKKIVKANRALAELKDVVHYIPNQTILINALSLQEAKDSSEIENIVTTHDELYCADVNTTTMTHQAKKILHLLKTVK